MVDLKGSGPMSDFWRFVFIMSGGCAGLCFGAIGWLLAGAWWTGQQSAAHQTHGKLDLPSDQVIDAAMVTLLGTPVAAIAGAFAGVGVAEWLARKWVRNRTR